MKSDVILSIDVGGTYYKAAVLDAHTFEILAGSLIECPSSSHKDKDTILDALRSVVDQGLQFCEKSEEPLKIHHIAFDWPGPFDYVKGCAMMKHKFQAIYALPLTPVIRSGCHIPGELPIVYHHDLHAFTYGVCRFGSGKGFRSVFCVTIGTGLGTGCFRDGRLEMNSNGTPRYPLFQKPYGEGIVEDIVSNRGLTTRYNIKTAEKTLHYSTPATNAKEIEIRAMTGHDSIALEVYSTMGTVLGSTLKPTLEELEIEALIIGGQISKGFHLFRDTLVKELSGSDFLKYIGPAKDLSNNAIRGCGALPLALYDAYRESTV
jgi:glucokinase